MYSSISSYCACNNGLYNQQNITAMIILASSDGNPLATSAGFRSERDSNEVLYRDEADTTSLTSR